MPYVLYAQSEGSTRDCGARAMAAVSCNRLPVNPTLENHARMVLHAPRRGDTIRRIVGNGPAQG